MHESQNHCVEKQKPDIRKHIIGVGLDQFQAQKTLDTDQVNSWGKWYCLEGDFSRVKEMFSLDLRIAL